MSGMLKQLSCEPSEAGKEWLAVEFDGGRAL